VLFFGFRILSRIFSLLVSAAVVYVVVTAVQVETASRSALSPARAKHAAAIVVTGTPGRPAVSADYRAKLRVASSLYSAGLAPLLIVGAPSGVGRSGALSGHLAYELKSEIKLSEVTGVTAKDAGTEFSHVEKLIGRGHRVIVVTDAINTLYMESVAANDRLVPEVVAPSDSKKFVFSQISPLFREASGVAVGRVIGFANATWATK
jgi:hypothetical protein